MKIGILSKRTGNFTGKMKNYFEEKGLKVKIYTYKNLVLNDSLLENDFYILKSKKLFFLYAGYYLEAHNIPVIPHTEISFQNKNRIEAHFLLKQAGLLSPQIILGTAKTLKKHLKHSDFPLILKPLMSSGSKGIKIINSLKQINAQEEEVLYLEKIIVGTHYLAYFIGDDICVFEKKPFENEHANVKEIELPNDIKNILIKWKEKYNLLFGHLDMVREDNTGKLFIVDPGTFPEFSNWNCENDAVSLVCNQILNHFKRTKNTIKNNK